MLPHATNRLYTTAREPLQRAPTARLVRPRDVVVSLGDPRAQPFDARVEPFSVARHLPAFACLLTVVGSVWAACAWIS